MIIHHLDNLPRIEKRITRSIIPVLIATPIILGWGVGIYFMTRSSIPTFVLAINIILYPIFIIILYKDIISYFNKDKFFMAFSNNSLILPLNYSIKKPKEANKLYLQLFTNDFQKLEFSKQKKVDTWDNKRTIMTLKLTFTTDQNLQDLSTAITQVLDDDGFQGSPLSINLNQILYSIDGNYALISKIKKNLQKIFPIQFNIRSN